MSMLEMVPGCNTRLFWLLGESARGEVTEGITGIISSEPNILTLNELLTMHLGPEDVLLNLSIDFDHTLSADQVEAAISRMERRIKTQFPEITRVFIEAQSWTSHLESQRADAEEPGGESGG